MGHRSVGIELPPESVEQDGFMKFMSVNIIPRVWERAGELNRMYQAGIRDLRAHFEGEDRAQAEAEEAEERQAQECERYTLHKLCEA